MGIGWRYHSVHNQISGYDVSNDVLIRNIDVLAMREVSFGIGTEVAVLNETGGYEVPLSRYLSGTNAYMLTFMSQNEELRQRLLELVEEDVKR